MINTWRSAAGSAAYWRSDQDNADKASFEVDLDGDLVLEVRAQDALCQMHESNPTDVRDLATALLEMAYRMEQIQAALAEAAES